MVMLAPTTSLSLGALTLTGYSRAGEGTSFYIPELKWLLDAGALVTNSPPHAIFITHTHSDHVLYASRLIHLSSVPLTIYLPHQAVKAMQRHVDAYFELIEGDDEDYQQYHRDNLHYTFQPVELDQEYTLRKGSVEYTIRPIECHHRIVCYGYSIFQTRQRLKQDYSELSSREVGQQRKQGVVVTESIQEPLLCFLGDTTHRVFELYPDLPQQHTVLIVECTFLDDTDLARAEDTKHMHWNHLRPIVQAHPVTMFVLIHFSLKYSSLRLRQFFAAEQTQHGLRNVHPMLIPQEVEQEWRKAVSKGQVEKGNMPTCQCRLCCAHETQG